MAFMENAWFITNEDADELRWMLRAQSRLIKVNIVRLLISYG